MLRVRDRAGSLLGLESAFRNAVSHSQISHWGEPNVDTMPLPLTVRAWSTTAQRTVGGSRKNDRRWHTSSPQDNTANGLRAHGEPFWHGMTQLHDRWSRKLHTVANLRNCEARRGHMARLYVGWSELRNRLSRLLRLGHFCVGARVPWWSRLHFQSESGSDQPAHGPALTCSSRREPHAHDNLDEHQVRATQRAGDLDEGD